MNFGIFLLSHDSFDTNQYELSDSYCRIHLNSETNHATQSFYSSVMLHATVEPEDQCPVQRLDYDRTNLLKNHPPEAEFVNTVNFRKSIIAHEKLSKRFTRNVFVFVPDHSNLK